MMLEIEDAFFTYYFPVVFFIPGIVLILAWRWRWKKTEPQFQQWAEWVVSQGYPRPIRERGKLFVVALVFLIVPGCLVGMPMLSALIMWLTFR
ncbi:MAG: hypothetical protein LBR44_02840 [Clostridiales Family XIII bacterium]|nr:hypothetical protein [Clostridiales Family XIII bacterium]